MDQDDRACDFRGLAAATSVDPSAGTCRFIVEIDVGAAAAISSARGVAGGVASVLAALVLMSSMLL